MITIDLGSNTIRVLDYDCETGRKNAVFEKIVRTADKTHATKKISEEAISRVIVAINEAKEKLGFEASDSFGVATAAFRSAKNGKKALELIKSKTDVTFQIIDGETEAYLTSLAITEKMPELEKKDCVMIVDIGGGSTEIVFKRGDKMVAQSFGVGIISLAQRYKDKDELALNIKKECSEIIEFIEDCFYGFARPAILCATAGTPTTLAAVKMGMCYADYDGEAVNGATLSLEDVEKIYTKLLKVSMDERSRLVGVGRQDLIVAGIIIFREIFEASGLHECIVFDDGLREGVAIAKCKKINF